MKGPPKLKFTVDSSVCMLCECGTIIFIAFIVKGIILCVCIIIKTIKGIGSVSY